MVNAKSHERYFGKLAFSACDYGDLLRLSLNLRNALSEG